MQTLTPEWADYELLDSGAGKKLERFGEFTLIRPEPQATWRPLLPAFRWKTADGEFRKPRGARQGEWKLRKPLPQRWAMRRKNLKFWVRLAPSGHVGVFVDQACHWDWIEQVVQGPGGSPKVLCLFGHTGLATLVAAGAGAEVTHVDASRNAVEWARGNQSLSGLDRRPIRWIVEDALTFVRREARRGNRYDAMIADPPQFGRGPEGEIWRLKDSLPELLAACRKVLSPLPLFVLLNVYVTVRTCGQVEEQAGGLRSCLEEMLRGSRMTIAQGALAVEDAAGRRILTSVFARAQ